MSTTTPPKAREWYLFRNADDPTVAEIHIIDFIGDWIDDVYKRLGYDMALTAKSFVDDLAKLPEAVKTIRVHINSPGGDVFGAVNIANALRDQQLTKGRTVETVVDGLAASAASIVMMAGSKVTVADNALVMVHNPWSIALGNAAEMRKAADTLDTVRDTIVATYRWHSSLDAEAIVALMDAETWMDADEAIAHGFATDKTAGLKAAAALDRRAIASLSVPEQFKARVDALLQPEAAAPPAPPAPPAGASPVDVLRACREGGCPELAEALVAASLPMADVEARIAEARERTAQAQARAEQITAICATAKLADRAPLYVKSALSIDEIKADLAQLTAQLDRTEIDASLAPGTADAGASWKSAFAKVNHRLAPAK